MCQLVSWIEKDNKLYYLTHDLIWNTDTGKELLNYLGRSRCSLDDLPGHGAIRWYYNLEGGSEIECNDFRSPKNFPDEIVEAIKRGEFRGLGTPKGLLNESTYAEYEKIEQSAFWDLFADTKNRVEVWR